MATASEPSSRRTWIRRIVVAVVLAFVGYAIIGLVEKVDWAGAWEAIGHVEPWQLGVLLLMLVARQALNASPLALFIPGLSVFRATVCDQAATLVSLVAPPPSDMVLRLKLLATWGIGAALGLAGSTMNVLVFYINRLFVPVVGLAILIVADGQLGGTPIAVVALAVGLSLLVMLRLAVRDPVAAERIGLRAGRLAHRLRSSVDPEAWVAKILEFRSHITGRFKHAFPRSLGLLFVMTLIDAAILLVALRCVGVPASALPAWLVIGSFLLWFPMTIMPLAGLGLLDAVLVAIFTEHAGQGYEAEILAALFVYRIVTLAGPALLGLVALGLWRGTMSSADPAQDG
ncbi:lysylphosphatidylglycerol synthase domain-containing protein [Marmoricola sp. RAF53]|uniref:lysylphosphatidylglycerol synthase domain-containing protein n=1 Tax=Marmoricola sp. RAF53 TaxID=3233059 RepID=UPI003F9C72E3